MAGTSLDPLKVTNGYAAPGTVSGTISFLNSGGYTGMGSEGLGKSSQFAGSR